MGGLKKTSATDVIWHAIARVLPRAPRRIQIRQPNRCPAKEKASGGPNPGWAFLRPVGLFGLSVLPVLCVFSVVCLGDRAKPESDVVTATFRLGVVLETGAVVQDPAVVNEEQVARL